MYTRLAVAVILAGLMAIGLPHPAAADQNDPRLDELFEQLHATEGAGEATRITRQIQRIWRHTDNARADAMMRAASENIRIRDFNTALVALDEVVAIAPDYAEGWSRRASVRYLVGDYEGAVSDIDTTLHLEPRHFAALSALGASLMMLDRPEEAESALEAALAINPHLSGAQTNLETLRSPGQAL